jgi:hypothetical protein
MNASRALQRISWLLTGIGILPVAQPAVRASEDVKGVTAVASKVSGDYARARLSDGSFQPEFYAFGQGGHWGGEMSDATIDKLKFMDVARAIAVPLAGQNYLPARDPTTARLLIMVYWGTTRVPGPSSDSVAYDQLSVAQANLGGFMISSSNPLQKTVGSGAAADAAMSEMSAALVMLNIENRQRDRLDFMNAQMLGYDSEGLIGTSYGNNTRGTVFGAKRDELVSEIEENRYFVVLMAYDFQLMLKQRKHKLLWETRFSVSERRNQFDKALPVMAQYASKYFGQDSHGLLRKQVPEGRVGVGEPKSLGEVEAPATRPGPAR